MYVGLSVESCVEKLIRMTPKLYMLPASQPVRAVQMTAKTIGLDLELIQVDIFKGETRTPEYLKMNPMHAVPTLMDDDGFTVWESHAIMPYIISKYAKDDSLYPKDIKKRAIVDQRLHFDSGVAFARTLRAFQPIFFGSRKDIDPAVTESVHEAYDFLERFLGAGDWIAGDFLSIADFSLIATISTLAAFIPVDAGKCPKVVNWLKRAESLPAYEINRKGLGSFKELMKSKGYEI